MKYEEFLPQLYRIEGYIRMSNTLHPILRFYLTLQDCSSFADQENRRNKSIRSVSHIKI